jgi:hypothetical protein
MDSTPHNVGEPYTEGKPFPEMLSVITDPNMEVFQVTTDLSAAGNTRFGFFSADGRMLGAGFGFELQEGEEHHSAPVFVNLETLEIHGFEWTPWSWRVGGSYFPGTDPRYMNRLGMGRIGISERWDPPDYKCVTKTHGCSAQHVVDEYGKILGTLPFGGMPEENTSHTCWRGANYEMLSHCGRSDTAPHWRGTIMCAAPVDCPAEHYTLGRDIPGAKRVELTRKFVRPDVCHIDWHVSGKTLVVASTHGNQPTNVKVNDKPVIVGVNAYIRAR